MKIVSFITVFVLLSGVALAQNLEAGKGELTIPDLCKGTTGELSQRTFYDNGSLDIKVGCNNGQLNGIAKKYTADGKIRLKALYENGKLNGTAKVHDEQGNIVYRDEYAAGVRTEHMQYNGKGELIPAP